MPPPLEGGPAARTFPGIASPLLLMPLLVGACAGTLCASPRSTLRWEYSVGAVTTYDDNLLEYSGRDLFEFRHRLNPDRFDVQTADDVGVSPFAEVGLRGGPGQSLRFREVESRYLKDSIRNHRSFWLGGSAPVHRGARVLLSAGYLPHYYLRTLWNEDLTVPYPRLPRYRPAAFRELTASAGASLRLSPDAAARLDYTFRRRTFLKAFPERDASLHALDLSVRLRAPGALRAWIRAGFERTLARGRDADDLAADTSDDPDVSARALSAGTTLEWTIVRRSPWVSISQSFDFTRRRFTTERRSDFFHFGRLDHAPVWRTLLTVGLLGHLRARAGYELAEQRTTAVEGGAEASGEAGSYVAHRVTLGLDWSSRESARRGAGAGDED